MLNPNGIVVAAAANVQGFPDVTSNGTASLVVWHDFRTGTGVFADVRATRVTRAGAVLDPTGIIVSDAARDQFEPEVSFDGADYLVAWTDLREGPLTEFTDIFASRVTPAGANLDGDGFAISAANSGQFRPAVATNGTTTLAVWTDVRNADFDVEAARVNRDGVVLDPNGIVVTRAASVQSGPSVASDGTNHLVAWVEQRNLFDSRILAGRVRPSGAHLDGTGIAIGNGLSPQVGFDGTNYLIVWNDPSLGTSIRAVRVSPAGQVLDNPSIAIADGADPSVAFNGTNYLVTWTQGSGPPAFENVRAATAEPGRRGPEPLRDRRH